LAASVKEIGATVTGVQGDVSNLADLDRLFAQISAKRAARHRVRQCIGGAQFAPLGKVTEDHFDALFNGNVKGLLFTVQKALPLLPDGASIILNASPPPVKRSRPSGVSTAPPRAAVRSFARTWTTDLKHRRIRVNAVSPGYTDTPQGIP